MNDWITDRSQKETMEFLSRVSSLLSELGGPLTRSIAQLVADRKFVELVNYQFDYTTDATTRDFVLARQVHALFQKQEWMNLGIDTKAVAEKKFWEMEERCKATNARVDDFRFSADVVRVIHRARRKIDRILGHVPKLEDLKFSFGPGATTAVKARDASPRAKLSASLTCSRDSLPFVGDLLAEVPYWALHNAGLASLPPSDTEVERCWFSEVTVHAGKLTYVPKDARGMRPIVVEPTLNGFAQKGIGDYIKGRLLRCVRIDLKDQTRNQMQAYRASIDGRFATVDMSSASDTVSWSLVRLLLPWEWFQFLSSWRTGDVWMLDGPRELEKFSSMGNAYTFELESLIFFSLAHACVELLDLELDVCTFGDDVILDSRGYTLFSEVLQELGFIVNNEKSFATGNFRESCGADWLSGNSIRPFYAKKALSERTLYTFHNFLVRNCEHELASFVHSCTNPAIRLYGPDGYGDGHLIGTYNLRTSRRLRRSGWEGGFFDTYALKPRRITKRYSSDWVYPSYSVYTRSGERDPTDPDVVRGSDGYAKVSIYTLARSIFGA